MTGSLNLVALTLLDIYEYILLFFLNKFKHQRSFNPKH